MGWNCVRYGTGLFTAAVLDQCATLLSNASPNSTPITRAKLVTRLTPHPNGSNRYLEANEHYPREVFQLHEWSNDGQPDDNGQPPANVQTIEMALALHLTLKRPTGHENIPTMQDPVGSAPLRRWWAVTVGCRPTVGNAATDLYPPIKARLRRVYKKLRCECEPPEWLVILDDSNHFPPAVPAGGAGGCEVDSLFHRMTQDPDIAIAPIPREAAYGPYANLCPSGYIQGVRLFYVGA